MTIPAQDYLRTLGSIRDRCQQVYEKALQGQLCYFDTDETKLDVIVDHVAELTHRRFSDISKIPPHSRLRHLGETYEAWRAKQEPGLELARKMVDLVIVSVLVDAGAGQQWKYTTQTGEQIGRSEGLAIASVDMFLKGYFAQDATDHVDAGGLSKLSVERMTEGFQVSEGNPMVGLEGRSQLLNRLASVIQDQPTYFPAASSGAVRPGNLVDYLLDGNKDTKTVPIDKLWKAVMSLGGIWPARIEVEGVQLGDVWPCTCLADASPANLVPFHKLSQWLTYSLIEVIESCLGITVEGVEQMTGLPEYRNGGLLVDYGLLTLKPEVAKRGGGADDGSLPTFEGSDPAIVEWRALTVVYLDKIHKAMETRLGQKLKLAQVLESGTWTAGREIAAKLRPDTAGPPIVIKSDGTIF
ncbi:hypothetical protein BDB00DRAFT_985386 [Zychaea mexicana]|uniref:uncharacterized protein n=1 Tax=Zychaea mexicana TaxID=64656 RepID=UPI0022FE9CF9|nr:uncharacterized protein BDB00DRAFT_985386 [Zychaea mexicana]KAI9469624.1 hypothetical protein BDB00DRAFT_985386 [Zychaea mexicana]